MNNLIEIVNSVSRYKDWTNALSGISNYMSKCGLKVNKNNFYEEQKLTIKFCKSVGYTSSMSGMYLYVGQNFEAFKKFINENKLII